MGDNSPAKLATKSGRTSAKAWDWENGTESVPATAVMVMLVSKMPSMKSEGSIVARIELGAWKMAVRMGK
jgi:hypothetical protein